MNQQYGSYDNWGREPTSEWRPQPPPQQPHQPYAPSPPGAGGGGGGGSGGGGGGNSGLLIGIIGVIAALVIVAAVGIVLFLRDDDGPVEARETSVANDASRIPGETSAPAPPSAETRTETITETRTRPAPAPAPGSGGSDRYTAGPGQYGVGLNTYRRCESASGTRWVGTGHSSTTCGFAENVARELAYLDISAAPLTVTAYSPATGENISMTCNRAQDSELDPVFKCEGGRNAVVYVYPW